MSAALHPDLAVHKEAADRPTLTFIDTNLVRLCVMENYFGIYLLVSACDEAIAFTVASVNVSVLDYHVGILETNTESIAA